MTEVSVPTIVEIPEIKTSTSTTNDDDNVKGEKSNQDNRDVEVTSTKDEKSNQVEPNEIVPMPKARLVLVFIGYIDFFYFA
jgi:hypothetical protein